jgi:hypothetical protein
MMIIITIIIIIESFLLNYPSTAKSFTRKNNKKEICRNHFVDRRFRNIDAQIYVSVRVQEERATEWDAGTRVRRSRPR